MSSPETAIHCDRVSKRYWRRVGHGLNHILPYLIGRLASKRTLWAVKDVSLDVERGSVLGVIGPNGSGKSTLLKLLASVSAPSSGSVEVRGRVAALLELGAGFHPELTGRENIALNAAVLGMTRAEIKERFDAIVAFSGVAESLDTPIKYFSSGMAARLGFAVAAHTDPDILLVDEVLAVGDAEFQQKCIVRVRSLLQAGAAMVLVSHDLDQIRDLCDTAILLRNGAVVQSGEVDEVCRHYEDDLAAQAV